MHIPEPDAKTEERDQHDFDEAVNRDGKRVLEILAAVAIVAAVAMSAVALGRSGNSAHASAAMPAGAMHVASVSQAPAAVQVDSLKIIPTYKVGPDGKKHDAFTQTNFNVKVGQPVKLVIDNTDEGSHSITAPAAGVNIVVTPGVHTYTLVVKTRATSRGSAWFPATPTPTAGRCSTRAS